MYLNGHLAKPLPPQLSTWFMDVPLGLFYSCHFASRSSIDLVFQGWHEKEDSWNHFSNCWVICYCDAYKYSWRNWFCQNQLNSHIKNARKWYYFAGSIICSCRLLMRPHCMEWLDWVFQSGKFALKIAHIPHCALFWSLSFARTW